MGTVRLYPLLLLLLFGSFQRAISQLPEWIGEVEGSGKTSYDAGVMLFFNHVLASKSWDRANCTEGTALMDPCVTITSFLILALKPENIYSLSFFLLYGCY